MKKVLLTIAVLMFAVPALADDSDMPRLVSVTGEAELFVAPDEVHVNLQVESFDPVLAKAKAANDKAIRGVFEIMKKHGVSEKDFQTEHFTVSNQDRYYLDEMTGQQRSKKGFFVTKNVAVALRDVSKFEAMYSDALEAGVNNIYGVEFKTSMLRKYRDEARLLAVKAAKEKATALAGELGEQIGRPYQIQENTASEYWPRPMMMNAMKSDMAGAEAGGPTVAFGQIKITASVAVSFELK